jgi:hypothetical protein
VKSKGQARNTTRRTAGTRLILLLLEDHPAGATLMQHRRETVPSPPFWTLSGAAGHTGTR